MVNLKIKCLVTATLLSSAFSLTPAALAGEGGAAGAAAFSIDTATGNVTGVAVAASVGKQDAFAGALNVCSCSGFVPPAGTLATNTAFALGSAGVISVVNVAPGEFNNVQGTADPALGTPQANSFTSNAATILLGTGSGDPIVNLGP